VVSLWHEAVLVGSVGQTDRVAVRASVREGTLHCLRLGVGPSARVLQETLLLRSDAISSLVTASAEQGGCSGLDGPFKMLSC
jgi:hypothetical protein